ncbi:MAG: hypothetical protein ACLFQM_01265 [Fidelibacterota bacterium]
MIRRQLTVLLIGLLFIQHCTIAVPVAVAKLDKSPDYAEIYDVNKLYKETYVKIIKTNDEIVYGEVLERRLLSAPPNPPINKIIQPEYGHFFPTTNDTLLLNTRFKSYSGLYTRFDFDHIFLTDEFGDEHAIKINHIRSASRNGETFNIGKMRRIVKNHQPYELKLKWGNKTILVSSDEIASLKRLKFKPWVPMGILAGLFLDGIVFFTWLIYHVGIPLGLQ